MDGILNDVGILEGLALHPVVQFLLLHGIAVVIYSLIWGLGRLCSHVVDRFLDAKLKKSWFDFRRESQDLVTMSLLLCWVPLGALLVLVAGMMRAPAKQSIALLILGQFGYGLARMLLLG